MADLIFHAGQYCMVPRALLRDGRISNGARVLGGLLWGYRNKETGTAFPFQATLAREIGKDIRTVQRHLNELEKAGWIKREQRRGTRQLEYHIFAENSAAKMAYANRTHDNNAGCTHDNNAGCTHDNNAGYNSLTQQSQDNNGGVCPNPESNKGELNPINTTTTGELSSEAAFQAKQLREAGIKTRTAARLASKYEPYRIALVLSHYRERLSTGTVTSTGWIVTALEREYKLGDVDWRTLVLDTKTRAKVAAHENERSRTRYTTGKYAEFIET